MDNQKFEKKEKTNQTKNIQMKNQVDEIINDKNLQNKIQKKRSKSKSDNSEDVFNELEKVCENLFEDESSDDDDAGSKNSYKSKDIQEILDQEEIENFLSKHREDQNQDKHTENITVQRSNQLNNQKQSFENNQDMNSFDDEDDNMIFIKKDKRVSEWQRIFEWEDTIQDANKFIFGNQNFRENQREIINCTLARKDALALIPTGGGKSLTFQLASIVYTNKVTFVFMPLLSLIEDNLNFVKNLGINAIALSGNNNFNSNLFHEIQDCKYRLVYLTPEKLAGSGSVQNLLQAMYKEDKLDRFVIDEVHCLSQWGQDFRSDYLKLENLRKNYPKVPILGLTATATIKVKEDLVSILGIEKDVVYFQSSFNRPNLQYEIRDKKKVDEDLIQLLSKRFQNKSGIIYCVSRKDCEKLCQTLKQKKVKCEFYHASLSIQKRSLIQKDWMEDRVQIMIATIAFGMGINKKDVRFVVHYSIPKSLEGYVQECGRGGRDGSLAECILYYSYGDRKLSDFFIVNALQQSNFRKNENLNALYGILDYCEEPYLCRRQLQLNFLGEEFDKSLCNQMCDNCKKNLNIYQKDFSKEAKIILNLILDLHEKYRGQIYITMRVTLDLLKGRKNDISQDIQSKFQSQLKTLKDEEIRRIILKMLITKILKEVFTKQVVYSSGIETISVYLAPGRLYHNLQNGITKICLSQGIIKNKDKLDIEKSNQAKEKNAQVQQDAKESAYQKIGYQKQSNLDKNIVQNNLNKIESQQPPNPDLRMIPTFLQNNKAGTKPRNLTIYSPKNKKAENKNSDSSFDLDALEQDINQNKQNAVQQEAKVQCNQSNQQLNSDQFSDLEDILSLKNSNKELSIQDLELIRRLQLIKDQKLLQIKFFNHQQIQTSFNKSFFEYFCFLANNSETNQIDDSNLLMDLLLNKKWSENQSDQQIICQNIKKFGSLFIQEYNHFQKLNKTLNQIQQFEKLEQNKNNSSQFRFGLQDTQNQNQQDRMPDKNKQITNQDLINKAKEVLQKCENGEFSNYKTENNNKNKFHDNGEIENVQIYKESNDISNLPQSIKQKKKKEKKNVGFI